MDKKERMIDQQLKGRDITDENVLEAMRKVDRKTFVPENMKRHAYEDTPLPIGNDQTISQPYIVAYMAQTLEIKKDEKVLEVGSGCGYNAAVLAQLASHVYSIEIIEWLADLAKKNIDAEGVENVSVRFGDGYKGWPEKSPFDKIILTAATPEIPKPLKDQLIVGGKILAPVSNSYQKLVLLEKTGDDEFIEHDMLHVRFVPMTGEARSRKF
ncbi:MAG TPA: protein-L-isoaspartate(D-aspartate) O-methyltransferase [Tangfeifania sp.]|nr:protein-L-isoaspartate(D-aspartate) O-methyltransferase [Tangfeifania sp.]